MAGEGIPVPAAHRPGRGGTGRADDLPVGTTEFFVSRPRWGVSTRIVAATVVVVSALLPTVNAIEPTDQTTFLAGTGGVPGGREAGLWLRDNVPAGAQLLTSVRRWPTSCS